MSESETNSASVGSALADRLSRISNSVLRIFVLVAVSGCGYRSDSGYHWESLYRRDVRTIAVPIFASTDYNRGVEFNLTKSIINQIEAKTPYKVVPRERADTVLEGEVVTVSVHTLSEDLHTALPQEQITGITVNFVWKDQRTGRILVERRGFQNAGTFYPTLGEDRFVGKQNATERLALGIVQEMQADW
jgi:hypothetical protein